MYAMVKNQDYGQVNTFSKYLLFFYLNTSFTDILLEINSPVILFVKIT